jgi:hypothetical protein
MIKINDRKIAGALVVAVSLTPILIFIAQFFQRANFPAHLEIMEGQNLFHCWRVASGLPLYVEPSIEAISPPYFPLFYYVVALLMKIVGPQWWTGRLVSFLSALGIGALYYHVGRRESGARLWGVVAAGLFFGAYGLTGAYYDLFRVDSLPLFLGFAAFTMAVYRQSWAAVAGASILLFLAVTGKQTELALWPVIFLTLVFANRKKGLAFAFASVLLIAVFVWLFNANSSGWFIKYTIDMVGHHALHKAHQRLFPLWILQHFGIPLACIVFYGTSILFHRKLSRIFTEPWFYFIGSSLLASFLIYRIHGSYLNSLIPAAMGMIAGLVVFAPRLWRGYSPKLPGFAHSLAPWALIILVGICLWMQDFPFALKHPLTRQVPTEQHRKAARHFNEYVRAHHGVIYTPFHTLPANPNWNLPHNVPLRDLYGSPWGKSYHDQIMADLGNLGIDQIILKRRRRVPHRYRKLLKDFDGPARLPKNMRIDPRPLTTWPKALFKRKAYADTPMP